MAIMRRRHTYPTAYQVAFRPRRLSSAHIGICRRNRLHTHELADRVSAPFAPRYE